MKESKFRLVIIGDGSKKMELQRQYSHLNNTFFYPRVPRAVLQEVLRRSDVLYAGFHDVSVFRYGQSLNKLVEYMASEKPIVISYSGFPSMINEAKCGFIVPATDVISLEEKIERIMQMSRVDRESLGKNGAFWLKRNRTYENLAQEYLELLRSMYK
jgi:glycosyltransferase involved in cell wall biosynthesis